MRLRVGVWCKMSEDKKALPKAIKTDVVVGVENDNVMLVFDQSISWLEMEPVVAIKIAEMIKEKAIEILRSEPKP